MHIWYFAKMIDSQKSAKFWHWTAKDLKFTKVTTGKGTWKKSVEHLSQGNDYITYNNLPIFVHTKCLAQASKTVVTRATWKKGRPVSEDAIASTGGPQSLLCPNEVIWWWTDTLQGNQHHIPYNSPARMGVNGFPGTLPGIGGDMFSRSLKGSQLQDVCGSGGLTQWNAAMSLKNPRQAFSAGFCGDGRLGTRWRPGRWNEVQHVVVGCSWYA